MAAHIASVAHSGIRALPSDAFLREVRTGDLLFCSGRDVIDKVIEDETRSPWSHVLMCWTTPFAGCWLTLEATFERGVHVGLLEDYIKHYAGSLMLARRLALDTAMIDAELARGLSLLDDSYDWRQEVSIAARKLCSALPLIQPKHELYCSGLQYVMSVATPYPLRKPDANMPTPEDLWRDPSVVPVCAME